MEERISKLLDELNSGRYDQEAAHSEYDDLLEGFIKEGCLITNYPKMFELLEVKKNFWYA